MRKNLLMIRGKEKNTELLQYIYSDNPYVSKELFYSRLEQSILVYEFLKKKQNG